MYNKIMMICTFLINLLLFICLTNLAECSKHYAPIIELKNYGKIRGIVQNEVMVNFSTIAEDIYLYQGIRYGKARRFDRPERADSWPDIYDAIEYRAACPQLGIKSSNFFNQTETISEDCLFLNVWTTKRAMELANKPKERRPVMAYIHGGAYKRGTIFNQNYDGGIFSANGNMVVVSIAYRLGPFGFLYTGDESDQANGNQGFYDQILALQWIQENIHYFGGDPNQVTVFGQSAGAFSTANLILSPLASGLFHRAILQSGSSITDTACASKSHEKSKAKIIAEKLNCLGNMTAITKCLRQKSIKELLSVHLDQQLIPIYGSEFLPLKPVEALKNDHYKINKVDLMFGANRDEGDFYVQNSFDGIHNVSINLVKKKIRERFEKHSYVEDVVHFYTKNLNDSSTLEEKRIALSHAYGDYHIICPTILYGEEYHRRFSDTKQYSYRLMAPVKSMFFDNKWNGVGHRQDLFYIFGVPFRFAHKISFTQHERDLSRDMIEAWIHFAQNGIQGTIGNTNIEWKEAFDGSSSAHFMALDSKHYHMVNNYFKSICDDFWRPKIFV
ncbi:acetylcholinesterase-like [Dermatophagoides pteronyssinus]|uniref:acetylcholinesterase-like n=1 Tax=Dermatophagoides pteronyssinus TaxID=6956 RepID=UPI003F66AC3E